MKLKFINLLLAVVFLTGSAQILTSCKDNQEDLYTQLKDDNLTLKQYVDLQKKILEKSISDLKKYAEGLEGRIKYLEDEMKKLDDTYVSHEEFNGLVDDYMDENFKNLVDAYIASVSEYKNLKEVLDRLNNIWKLVDGANGEYETIAARFLALEEALKTVQNTYVSISSLETTLQSYVTNESLTTILNQYAKLSDLDDLNSFMTNWENELPTIATNAQDAYDWVNKNKADFETLTELLAYFTDNNKPVKEYIDEKIQEILDNLGYATPAELETAINGLRDECDQNLTDVQTVLQGQIDDLLAMYLEGADSSLGQVNTELGNLSSDLENATGRISDLEVAVDNAIKEIERINDAFNKVLNRLANLENRISSVVLQGTDNPVLGYLATPLGINMNMLMGYYGENTNPVGIKFPNTRNSIEYNNEAPFTDADAAILQQCGFSISGDAESFESGAPLMNDADGNIGTLYVTFNPANIDLSNKTFTVVNSQDKAFPVELKNLRPSTQELTFGYTRTETSANGFYEADATIDPTKASAIRVTIDQGLKQAAKSILTDRNTSSILRLGNALYNQFNSILPALGIKAAWEETEYDAKGNEVGKKNQAVYSQYGIAATVFRPLSYRFLYDKSFRQIHMPDLGDLNFELSTDGINIDLSSIKLNLNLTGVNYDIDLDLNCHIGDLANDLKDIQIEISGLPSKGEVDAAGNITFTEFNASRTVNADMSNLAAVINDYLDANFQQFNAEVNAKIKDAFNNALGQIQDKVNGAFNEMIAQIQVKIDESLADVVKDLQDQLNGKVQKFVDRFHGNGLYNRLQSIIDRVNRVLDNPNHYLQTTLMYRAGNKYGNMSNVRAFPTQVVLNGGNAMMLVPTTYTGEVVTPAYKKFVAVTNVYKTADSRVNAQAGDSKCLSILKAANNQKYMCEVVPGERRTMPLLLDGAQGYTIEILYQGLDYSGITSTQKYYVSVK